MTTQERNQLIARLQAIVHVALVEIRNLAPGGRNEQIRDLADVTEFIPRLLLRWDDEEAARVRPSLEQYESAYPASRRRYTGILDLDDETFRQMFNPTDWPAEAWT
jgi:hypothetical protein